jgi:L-2-hydroxyglutarate oxidase LhgO
MDRVETVVIGAGVVGLAVARELALSGREVVLLEQCNAIGTETSARNSEVIHGGPYYPTGSLKARLCVAGRERLYDYCEGRGVPFRRCGKLIVANGAAQEQRLRAICEQAGSNGVPVEWLNAAQANALEPEVRCTSALLSPHTGIIDSHAFMLALLGDLQRAGGELALASECRAARVVDGGFEVDVLSGDGDCVSLRCASLINSAGLAAPAMARRIAGLAPEHVPQAWYAKGHYFSYTGRSPFSHLVYPMPGEAGLGIHGTLDLAGRLKFGPDVEWIKSIDYEVDASRVDQFVASIREYWPAVDPARLAPAYAGIRPKIVGPGAPAADFMIQLRAQHGVPRLVNLFGIESPGLTSALAIASAVAADLPADH